MSLTHSAPTSTDSDADSSFTAAAAFAAISPAIPSAERGDCWLSLSLRHAGTRAVRIGYECQGPVGLPVVVVLGGISANRHVAASRRYPEKGWWQEQVGAGNAIDPSRFRIIGIDWLGADGMLDAPIDTADQADALAAVLDALGVRRVHALIGASYGAMVGLQFAARHGQRLRHLLAISGAHRPHPFATAWRCIQRDIARFGNDPDTQRQTLSLARQLALLSYRTPEEFAQRFTAPPERTANGEYQFAAQSYLRARGADFANRFDTTAFLRLSESIDLHGVDPTDVRVPVTLVSVHEDRLVLIEDFYDLAERLPGPVQLHAIHSLYGHDAFLKEREAIARVVGDVLPANDTRVAA